MKRGDTLYAIAWRHRLDYQDVARWNGIGRDYVIHPGQVLKLYPSSRTRRPRRLRARLPRAPAKRPPKPPSRTGPRSAGNGR